MFLYIMAFHFTLLYSRTSTNGHLSTTATSPQRALTSVPKVAVERFDCILDLHTSYGKF